MLPPMKPNRVGQFLGKSDFIAINWNQILSEKVIPLDYLLDQKCS